jgi:tRNA-dihydrouridine synthase B
MNLPRLTIGPLRLETPVLLAPMAGYTDWPFRIGIRSLGGIGLAFTEMISPDTLLHGAPEIVRALAYTSPEDQPLGCQIYGKHPDLVARGAKWLEERGAQLVDINMGCPQKQLSGRGRGAGLLRTPELAVEIVAAVRAAVKIPVTVKMRLGWDDRDTAPRLAATFAPLGVAAITVHGRTRAQGFSGAVDREAIRRVVEAVPRVPVIANGDITSVESALRMFEETGCAGIMLGRGPLANPWIMRDIARALAGQSPLPPPTAEERVRFMTEHFERLVEFVGEQVAVVRFRKWIRLCIRGRAFSRDDLVRMMKIEDAETWRKLVPAWVRCVWEE